jgi:hypothetical protein
MSETSNNSKEHNDLKQQYEILVLRVNDMQADAMAAKKELEAMSEKIADAQLPERSKLIRQRAEFVNQNDALVDALKILAHRRDVACLAIYEFQEYQAEVVAKELTTKSQQIGKQLNQVMLDLRNFFNGPKNDVAQAKRDEHRIELETQLARYKVEASIAKRDAVRAGYALEKVRGETEAIRQELGIQEGWTEEGKETTH